ncbi:MAG: UvrD-helicase domain-containing protein [Bacteroidota bacterium]|nr:UvrD-helicase domain-containing protein [Bacteroidota bacterium]
MNLLEQLNPVQRKATAEKDGPVMIIAGAGSGKTRVLTYRVAYLIQQSVQPYEILALTFTNKAAKEMKSRIEKLVGVQATNIWAGTFHSIFARILRRECEALGYDRSFTIYDTEDQLNVVKAIMASQNISAQQFNPRAVHSRISGAKNQLVSPEQYDAMAKDPFSQKTAEVYAEYQKKLFANNAMDFDDLLLKPIELFQRGGNTLEKYQHRFRYLLVDEYQDTNRAQYMLINMLARKFRNLCVVGDDAQSIYSFRGADIRNILDFERDYPDCKVFRLEQNYRSTKKILAAADSVIKNNKRQIHKTLWTDNAAGDPVVVVEAEDDKDEGVCIASHIKEECAKRKLDLKDFCVLYRTNAQSRSIEDALRRGGISYVIVGGVEFYKRKEIKDVLAYLRVIVNPKDEESLLRIINYPPRGIGEATIERVRTFAEQLKPDPITFFEALQRTLQILRTSSERAKNALSQFISLIEKYKGLRTQMSASELARALVDELGILRRYKEEATPEAMSRWENIQELLSAISEHTANNPDATLESFLGEVALVSPADDETEGKNSVTLMTLHAAKGLEFPVVFIAGLEEGLFPLYQAAPDMAEMEEERRLFYVGITRSMTQLFLSHTRMRYRFGELTYPVASRFLSEIDEKLLSFERSRGTTMTVRREGVRRERPPRFIAKGTLNDFTRAENSIGDESPAYEDESQEVNHLHVGAHVEHESFGRGKVLQMVGKGESAKAVVLFDSVGPKNLMLKYARLRVL